MHLARRALLRHGARLAAAGHDRRRGHRRRTCPRRQLPQARRLVALPRVRRDDLLGRHRTGVAGLQQGHRAALLRRRRPRHRRARRAHPVRARADLRVHDASRLLFAPVRAPDAALHFQAGQQGHLARPLHDPARLMHHEAQLHGGDDAHHLARDQRHPPVRPSDSGQGLRRAHPLARGAALRDHRLPRHVAPAKLGRLWRVLGPPHHPRLPGVQGRGPPQRLPHPGVSARHQPRLGRHVRHAHRPHWLRQRRQH
mmetsp:Transcript_20221/g.39282  ORF Transcript_20221/g.39282 Transcript_20221/m.39282 type:complete len:255 (+) Transcript_20221:1268-2032(+)